MGPTDQPTDRPTDIVHVTNKENKIENSKKRKRNEKYRKEWKIGRLEKRNFQKNLIDSFS